MRTKPSKKMPPERVRQLRQRYNQGELLKVLAADFGISMNYVRHIGLGYARKDVD